MPKPRKNPMQAALDRIDTTKDTALAEKQSPPTERKKRSRATRSSGRDGTVLIGGHFSPDVARQLKILAAEDNATIQELLLEAMNLLFAKKNRKLLV